ncbi:hypothetical protein D3C78_1070590 [compost metagenome]
MPRSLSKPFAVPPSPGKAPSRRGASMFASRFQLFSSSWPLTFSWLRPRVRSIPGIFHWPAALPLSVPRAVTLFCFTLPSSCSTGTCNCQLPPCRLPRVVILPSNFAGHSGHCLAVLMPLSVSCEFQLMALLQSTSAVRSVLPCKAANRRRSSLNCSTLPLPSSVSTAGGRSCPLILARVDKA